MPQTSIEPGADRTDYRNRNRRRHRHVLRFLNVSAQLKFQDNKIKNKSGQINAATIR